ncbi:MAG: GerMN domain-containing protein [Clostridia bacterium]|nr:GerMN domain-containing protein [Clostridia bacterium]
MRFRALMCIVAILVFIVTSCAKPIDDIDVDSDSVLVEAGLRRTVIYYLSDEGFIVPVMRMIPWEEGIGKAALQYLVADGVNTSQLSQKGLNPVIPANTEIALRIDDGHARVDLSGEGFPLSSADAEYAMVVALVNTLVEFPTIDSVSVSVNGNSATMANGVELPQNCGRINLNVEVENVETMAAIGIKPVGIYMPNVSGSLMIPITKYTTAEDSFYTAVKLMCEGSNSPAVHQCFPQGVSVLDAYISGTTATVALTGNFAAINEVEGLLESCYKAMYLTALEYGQVSGLRILVDGDVFDTGGITNPVYPNEF